MSIGPYILLLPDIALEKIFSFLTYDEIARNRAVCKKFNDIGSNLLSRGFLQIEKRHAAIFKRVKSMLPRRESERRIHPLFRRCDILSSVETRISMLNMTYMKYIHSNMCCFIPGKVLDELERVLDIVENIGTPPRTHELLQELRDISSMAMEYFDEKILPSIKGSQSNTRVPYHSVCPSTSNKAPKVFFVQTLQDEIRKITKANKKHKCQINILTKVSEKLYTKIQKQNHTIRTQSRLIKQQETKLNEQSTKLQVHDSVISDLKKNIDEWEQKFSDLTSELVRAREDAVRAILPPMPDLNITPSNAHKTTIRPRLSQVQSPNMYIMELERKRRASVEFEIPNKLRFIMPLRQSSFQLKEKLNSKINENITQNISKDIRADCEDTSKKKYEFAGFFSSSLEALLRNPINSIKSRKRKMIDEIDLS